MSLRRSKRIATKNEDGKDNVPALTHSEKSHISSTSSQRRALGARAARELAELQQKEIAAAREKANTEAEFKRREIEAEKVLIQARLAEDLASLHSRSSTRSEKATERWIERSRPYFNDPVIVNKRNEDGNLHSHDNQHDEPRDVGDSRGGLRADHSGDEDQRDDNDWRAKDSVLNKLTCSLTKALKFSQSNNDKLIGRLTSNSLPNFSGDALDWLRFKNAYDITTRIGHYSEEENLARLQRCLQGEAWEAVAARLIATTSASDVMKVLEMRFGRSDLVLGRLIAEMKRVPKLTGLRSEVVLLATKVDNCVAAILSTNNVGYLHSPELISEILKKLSEPLFYRWIDYSKGAYTHQPRLTLLSKYLMSEAQAICESGAIEPSPSFYKFTKNNFKPRTHFMTNVMEEGNPKDSAFSICDDTVQETTNLVSHAKKEDVACVFCSEVSHSIKTCPKFKSEHIDKRWEWVVNRRLCFRCLSSSHRRDRCKSKKKCPICGMSGHHSLLHKEKMKTGEMNNESDKETAANVWSNQRKKVYLKVVPVHIDGPAGSVSTYALLDEGSTVTLVEKDIVDQIGVDGPESEMNLQGAIGNGNNMSSRIISLTIRTCDGVHRHRLDRVRTVDNLTLPNYVITRNDFKYDHLRNIPLTQFEGKPSLLIGQDNWHLIVSREVKEGKKNEPVASRTLLGWVLHGFSSSLTDNALQFSCHLRHTDDELHNLVDKYFLLDSIGIKYQENRRFSPEETRAMNILDSKSNKLTDRWETGLLWKSDDVEFPCNRRNAEHRLRIIEKSMDSDSNFACEYSIQVQNMLDKGYAKEVLDTPQGRVWFLPHFGVRNPNKPAKLRLVHDAKAETRGVSLNTELLSGPDLLNSLLGVLMRFRERSIAVTGDIREMFMQVKIIKEDQNAQCFLWRGMDRKNPPRIFRMSSMIFGAKSSPCTATYILRRNADEFASSHPRAVEAIKKRHYVDDYLDSADTEEETKQLVKDVTMIHKAGGFDIRGWASNRPDIVPRDSDNADVSLLQRSDSVERVLGVTWRPVADSLGFDLSLKKLNKDVVDGVRKPTKRDILKIVMSIFDPLGMLCPFMIKGKILLQNLWRSKKDWDEQIDDAISQKWFSWLKELKNVGSFAVPRSYGFTKRDSIELHVFVDASEEAYACVAYLRRFNEVVFVAAKTRVAPLKCTTIPKLELQAALIGARLGHTVSKEHSLDISKRYFWTDSKTVWFWINRNPKKEKIFIANRLAEIDELTKSNEWRWLPGTVNVADEVTRAKDTLNSRWIVGPEFLRLPENNWPQFQPDPTNEFEVMVLEETPNLRKVILDERFSNWRRLVRSMSWVILYIDRFIFKRSVDTSLTPDLENRAEVIMIRQAQAHMFRDDISRLRLGNRLKFSSKLLKLNPELNVAGLLVAKSRLDTCDDLSEYLRRPIILDAKHNVTRLIIKYYHHKLGHHNSQTLLNELRQVYYIFGLRNAARKLTRECVTCKCLRGRPAQPMMAALPENRLQHHCRPFHYCGIDLFGPMTVTIGRRHEKRWGVIFTCFSTRAVHMELASSLSTDSTILAIRRMAARRGFPYQIHSDNGTNFRSADKELRKAVQDLLRGNDILEKVNNLGVKWTFNPPDAAHMGGVWERLIKSIKTALSATLHTLSPKEEVLLTLLVEAENIVNSRPLTHVSLDINDEEALTPNHFLLGSSNPLPSPGIFSDDDLQLRKQWRLAQRLADKFWCRWVREYLPSLQVRHRWTSDAGSQVKIGDLVVIADPASPRNVWARGRIVGVTPGRDGRVRMAEVATKGGVIRRPVNRLVILMSLPPHDD